MTTYKTTELDGALLDAAVAMAEGIKGAKVEPYKHSEGDGKFVCMIPAMRGDASDPSGHIPYMNGYCPSRQWSLGGPIIEREKIALCHGTAFDTNFVEWHAIYPSADGGKFTMRGPTLLIAAMRAYVASKLGDTVEME